MKITKSDIARGFQTADQLVRSRMSTGLPAVDELLGGGLESGIVHLFYGDRGLHDDLLQIAVHAQIPRGRGGFDTSSILIDSANILKIEKITDYAFDFELEPEEVMDRIYITRAFNSSQTYDLIMNQMESFFDCVRARLLLVTGLPDLYLKEGLSSESVQQITHMATKLMTFTLERGLFTIVTAPSSDKSKQFPAGGKTLASCAQIHVHVEEAKTCFRYTLAKHPSLPVRRTSRSKPVDFGISLPLTHFLETEED